MSELARAAELATLAGRIAVEAGQMVLAGRRAGIADVDTKSTATDMVTEFDRAAEALLVQRLRAARPDDGLVGEEGTDREGTSGIRWLLDPIDGTTNFLYGLPGFAVSVAAADSSGVLVGAVYLPDLDELFRAHRGGGATLGEHPIRCGTNDQLATALVGTGFSYRPEWRVRQAGRVARMIGQVRDIRRFGAAAADLCYVACGRLDAYFEEHLNPWDLAAGELIAREAGCRSGDFSGGPPRPEQVLVAPPQLFEPLRELINQAS
jgi:myo-inositol-1(or 4)-monophosphatase